MAMIVDGRALQENWPMKPVSSSKHEAQESSTVERKEHTSGKEGAKAPYKKKGLNLPSFLKGKR